AIEVPDAAVELPLDAEADQRREPGQEVRGFVDEQGLREPLELRPRLVRAILVGDAGCRPDQLAERPVAGALPERRRATLQPTEASRIERAHCFRHQPGLADAGLAGYGQNAA